MKLLKSDYDLIVHSDGLSALFSAAFCSTKNYDTLVIHKSLKEELRNSDFMLQPYELPVIALERTDYLSNFFSLIGLPRLNNVFEEDPEPLSIIIGNKRFDYFLPYIEEEIYREFQHSADNFSSFLNEIMELEQSMPPLWVNESGFPPYNFNDWYKLVLRFPHRIRKLIWSNINVLYKRHKLPMSLRLIIDSILFVLSGVLSNNFPAICAIRILVSAIYGIRVTKSGVYSFANEFLKLTPSLAELRNNVDIIEVNKKSGKFNVRLNSYEGWVSSKSVISDFNRYKETALISLSKRNINNPGEYVNILRYPFTVYVNLKREYLPVPLSKWTVLLDADSSGWFNHNDVYIIRYVDNEDNIVVRVTTFIPYIHFQSPLSLYREKANKMLSVLSKVIPFLDEGSLRVFPDPRTDRFDVELFEILSNIQCNSFIYDYRYKKVKYLMADKGILRTGRQIMPWLGFEGLMISGLKAADRVTKL